jgi:hypothetical protein
MNDDWVYGDMMEMTVNGGERFLMFLHNTRGYAFGVWVIIATTWGDTYGPGWVGQWEYPTFAGISRRIEDE